MASTVRRNDVAFGGLAQIASDDAPRSSLLRPLLPDPGLLGLALTLPKAHATITNGKVTLGVNASGDLNDTTAGIGGSRTTRPVNDGTVSRVGPCEGWGAGAGGPDTASRAGPTRT